ncbi:hypothetical protein J6590_041565 [Homalodisca vitripennis]|nr:hypothetical protein J6590_041565 [Homalodisca vitripennis]
MRNCSGNDSGLYHFKQSNPARSRSPFSLGVLNPPQGRQRFPSYCSKYPLYSSWPPTRVYINDHLTPYNKMILGKARSHLKEKIAFAWTRDYRIFIRHTVELTDRGLFKIC